MKFSDGLWLNKKNYDVNYAVDPYEIKCSDKSISVLAAPYIIYNRGMTLGGPNLEIKFSSPSKDIIKVSIVHYKGTLNNSPEFELNTDSSNMVTVSETDEYAELVSGDTSVRIEKGQEYDISYFHKGRLLTGSGKKCTSYITENELSTSNRVNEFGNMRFWEPADRRNTYMREQLSLDIGETVYGFGEKFTPFVKNGQTVEIWNSDGGTCSDQSYKSIPFYISSKSYGVFVNTPDRVSFEAASDNASKVSFTVSGESLEYYIIAGNDPSEVISNYTFLTGRPALPPAETFGLWLSTSFVTEYDEKTVLSFIDGMKERNIPLEVFHFDCFWMKEYEWTSFEWNKNFFPDPQGLLDRISERGISMCVWINPYIAQRSALFDEGVKNGYFLKNPDGSTFQCDMWQPGMAIVDFTNQDACSWFGGKLEALCSMGIKFFKTDFGERIPVNVRYHNGMDPVKMHNYYSYLYNKTVFDVLEKYYGKDHACLFSRSATAGGQKFPVHWGGDCSAEYSSMAETLRGGLSLTCSGFGFFSHDIGGFEATATPDIYKRWCAFGLMSSHSRLHGNYSYRVPWLFDEEAVDVLRSFTELKGKLMPYLYSAAVKTSVYGIPMMRAMFIDFPEDRVCQYADRQYMFGDSLLCAPVFNERSEAEFYLPEGKWTDIITGKKYTGGKYFKETCSYLEMPVLARENSIVIYGDFKGKFAYDYAENAQIVLYEPAESVPSEAVCCNTHGKEVFRVKTLRNGNTVKIQLSGNFRTASFRISGSDKTFKCDKEEFEISL